MGIQSLVELAESEREILLIGQDIMARLVTAQDWLPTVFTVPNPAGSKQFQIYRDGLDRFSVVSTVLGRAAFMTIFQPSVWEITGVLHGPVSRQQVDGSLEKGQAGELRLLQTNAVEVRPSGSGPTWEFASTRNDPSSVLIHVYGGDISQIRRLSVTSGGLVDPQSSYANAEHAPPYDIFSIQREVRD